MFPIVPKCEWSYFNYQNLIEAVLEFTHMFLIVSIKHLYITQI